jgi:hypothetical protein
MKDKKSLFSSILSGIRKMPDKRAIHPDSQPTLELVTLIEDLEWTGE